ncbi:hypothetical protein CHS0354_041575 [Potamilus streckersoni]|uniref:Uncharacterized protein n=1 Tax=Potamilus streckersoni TaxID=2493646 RepID=A0AAE0WCU5_9BIVA|nr:hypothetical protein CHS0354_041575 [Potamilus streckersoni]
MEQNTISGENFLRQYFRSEEEERPFKAFRDPWVQTLHMSDIPIIDMPKEFTILVAFAAKCVNTDNLQALVCLTNRTNK